MHMQRRFFSVFLALLLPLLHISAAPQDATAIASASANADGSGDGNANAGSNNGNGDGNGNVAVASANGNANGDGAVASANAVAIASPPGTVGVESGSVALPAGGYYSTVQAKIDGKDYTLLLDTGSARLYVSIIPYPASPLL